MKKVNINSFHGIKAKIDYEPIMHKYSEKTRKILVSSSPKSGRAGRITPYYMGWEVNSGTFKNGYRDVVWNRTNWQLTHLLENGHFISNQGALAWSAPRKHIKPAYLDVRDPYIKAMQKAKIDVDFE